MWPIAGPRVTVSGHAGPRDNQQTLAQAARPQIVAPRARVHSSVPEAVRNSTGIDKTAHGQRGSVTMSQLERCRPRDREWSVERGRELQDRERAQWRSARESQPHEGDRLEEREQERDPADSPSRPTH